MLLIIILGHNWNILGEKWKSLKGAPSEIIDFLRFSGTCFRKSKIFSFLSRSNYWKNIA